MPEPNKNPEGEISDFLFHLCHDLRTPVRAIRAHSELMAKNPAAPQDAGFQASLGFVLDGARNIESLADSVASYSVALQIQPGTFQPASLEVLLRNALARLRAELQEKQAEVNTGKLPHIRGDADRLVQLFEHLIRNALRHGGQASPQIRISAEERPADWLFAIKDNGAGIEQERLESIFQPFVRARSSGRKGHGLGLAICRAIVERHGGRIWAESPQGEGATFFFTLPRDD